MDHAISDALLPKPLLESARAEFLAHGFNSANVGRIARTVGMSKKTIYRYVSSKEELFLAVVASVVRGPAFVLASVDAHAPMEMRLTAYMKAYAELAFSAEATGFYRLVVSESVRFPAIAGLYIDTVRRFGAELLAEELARHAASGEIRLADPSRSATMLVAMVVADPLRDAALGLGSPPAGAALDVLVDEAVRTFLHGVVRAS